MKLRSKNTGKTIHAYPVIRTCDGETDICYHSINELNAEWEDYEPKTNSRFLLVKDLPTFKAGQVFHLSPKGNLVLDDGKFGICAYSKQTLEKFPNILEDWFEPINDDKNAIDIDKVNELIDKIHPEPLIKDEKIRKAIKYIFPEYALIHIEKQGCKRIFEFGGTRLEMDAPNENAIKHGSSYTITELCGEGE